MMTDLEKNILKNVSRETYDNLKTYQSLLCEWQNKFNLVSKNSLPDAWNRHFLDSAQLMDYIDESVENVCDFGSGAGFPALALAIICKERFPKIHFTLIESIAKKTLFLNEVIKRFNLNAVVINDRIENITGKKFDIITARAVTSLDKLLEYAKMFSGDKTKCLFLKGKTFNEEIAEAKKHWDFLYNAKPSLLSQDGVVLEIKNIRRKK